MTANPNPSSSSSQGPLVVIGRPTATTANYGPQGNSKALIYRSQPPQPFNFDRASLADVLRLLAEDAGIPFVGLPATSPQAQSLVTFRMTASPFQALESVMRQHGLRLEYDNGVWYMRGVDVGRELTQAAEDANELVGVVYQLRYDPADRVDFRSEGGSADSEAGGGTAMGGAGGTGATSPASPNLPLQNSQKVFAVKTPRIVNDVRAILGLKPLRYDSDSGQLIDEDIEPGTEVARSGMPQGGGIEDESTLPLIGERSAAGEPAQRLVEIMARESRRALGIAPVYVPPQRPQVIYNSDTNVLWVVATRKQHRWVAEYLSKVDKPQSLIAIEVKFVETKKNPRYDLGINWENTLGTGITLRGNASAGVFGEDGFGFDREKEWGSTNFSSSSSGNSVVNAINNAIINNQTNLTITDIINSSITGDSSSGSSSTNFSGSGNRRFNLDFRNQNTTIPYEAVLSMDQVSVTLQAFMQDRDTSIVQYPRVLTINNREVAITSAENTPVNAGVQQTQSGSTATQTGTLGYLPIGTQINILPKTVGQDQIALTVAITISSIIGSVPINLGTGFNEYPITTERVYNATLQVDSGYTLAVGGLEKVADSNVQGGVPVLKDIPGLGYFFKNKSKARDRVNLIIFITPYLISDVSKTPGISETPESIVPQRPGGPPTAPTFSPDGRLVGGASAFDNALAWLEFQLRYFRNINAEGLADGATIEKLRGVISVARVLAGDREYAAAEVSFEPADPSTGQYERAQEILVQLNQVLAGAQESTY